MENNAIPEYTPPSYGSTGFHCPYPECGVYSQQTWYLSSAHYILDNYKGVFKKENTYAFAHCYRCGRYSIWDEEKLIYPLKLVAPRPHKDMPEEIKKDFREARQIFNYSPRGSAALLRLATEKLVEILIEKSKRKNTKNLNKNIGILVEEGLPTSIQKALDSLRVIGSEAVHPGVLNLNDNEDIALKLFKLVNLIIENRISQVEEIENLFKNKIPKSKKEQIEKRDSKQDNKNE